MTSLANPVFSEDFSIVVADDTIYHYNPKSTVDANYALSRADTFYTDKQVFKLDNNFIILTWKLTAGKYDYKIQFNTLSNGISTKI